VAALSTGWDDRYHRVRSCPPCSWNRSTTFRHVKVWIRIQSDSAHTRPGRSFRIHGENTPCATGVRRRGRPSPPVKFLIIATVSLMCSLCCPLHRANIGRDCAARRIGETKDACEAASVQACSRTSAEDLGCPVTPMIGELTIAMPRCRELDPSDHGRRHRWVSQSAGRGPEGDVHHHPDVAIEPDRYHPLGLALSRIVKSVALLWALSSGGSLGRPQSATEIARSEGAWGSRVRPSRTDRCRSASLSVDAAEPP
jgi:hypothetical protein